MANSKKKLTSAVAVVTAAALLLGGTFAWQSISQEALNEASAVVNPGGRLHDDFNGENKDVYVENFADDNIYARVRLDEYMEITPAAPGAAATVVTGGDKADQSTWTTHYFDATNATDEYWTWTTGEGASTVYMPTFNMNKDSLEADINGTYAGTDGDPATDEDRYDDYVTYEEGESLDGTEIYDADANDVDEYVDGSGTVDTNWVEVAASHEAKTTGVTDNFISMQEWIDGGYGEGAYWVYDTDGWVYWAQPIKGGETTGLLLDKIELAQVMDDSWYYGINVVAQFVTADDLGKADGTGFYDAEAGTAPSDNALALLQEIGVNTTGEEGGVTMQTLTLSYDEPFDSKTVNINEGIRIEASSSDEAEANPDLDSLYITNADEDEISEDSYTYANGVLTITDPAYEGEYLYVWDANTNYQAELIIAGETTSQFSVVAAYGDTQVMQGESIFFEIYDHTGDLVDTWDEFMALTIRAELPANKAGSTDVDMESYMSGSTNFALRIADDQEAGDFTVVYSMVDPDTGETYTCEVTVYVYEKIINTINLSVDGGATYVLKGDSVTINVDSGHSNAGFLEWTVVGNNSADTTIRTTGNNMTAELAVAEDETASQVTVRVTQSDDDSFLGEVTLNVADGVPNTRDFKTTDGLVSDDNATMSLGTYTMSFYDENGQEYDLSCPEDDCSTAGVHYHNYGLSIAPENHSGSNLGTTGLTGTYTFDSDYLGGKPFTTARISVYKTIWMNNGAYNNTWGSKEISEIPYIIYDSAVHTYVGSKTFTAEEMGTEAGRTYYIFKYTGDNTLCVVHYTDDDNIYLTCYDTDAASVDSIEWTDIHNGSYSTVCSHS